MLYVNLKHPECAQSIGIIKCVGLLVHYFSLENVIVQFANENIFKEFTKNVLLLPMEKVINMQNGKGKISYTY